MLRLCALLLAVSVAALAAWHPAQAQHRILVKFYASPTVDRAVNDYRPASFGEAPAAKAPSPWTGLAEVDATLRDLQATTKRALIPRLAQDHIARKLPARKTDPHASTWTLTEFQFPEHASIDVILARLNALPQVAYAEPRQTYRALPYAHAPAQTPTPKNAGAHHSGLPHPAEAATPDDPRFGAQYAQHNTGQTGGTADSDTDALEAWDIKTGSHDVVVAVIDSGIDYLHPDLAANIWTNPGEIPANGIDDDQNGYVDDVHGYDFFHGDSDPMDDQFHGTHVAGTVGAVGNNGIGVTGMAWQVKLIAVKFLGPGGSGSAAEEAVAYGLVTGAPISNNSWGGGGQSEAMGDLLQLAQDSGHLFVAAAGNDATEDEHFPAAQAVAMAVSSTTHDDLVSDFSTHGTWVEISAPGSAILSTFPAESYSRLSGTSMASPQVAGAAALLKAEHPDWTADQIRARLKDTADPIDHLNPGYEGKLGSGRLNVHQALLPATPRLQITSVRVDDDQFGLSSGNLDGAAGPGETIELWVRLSNVGAQSATAVSARLSANAAQVQTGSATYGDIPFLTSGAASGEPFRLFVPSSATPGQAVDLTIDVTDGDGNSWTLSYALPVAEATSITGVVTERGTGRPIPNARVSFDGSRADFALTDHDGAYEISGLLSGDITLTASATGFSPSAPEGLHLTAPAVQDFQLGAPELRIAPPAAAELAWGEQATVNLTIENAGTDDLRADLIELPAGSTLPVPTVKVAVVRSASIAGGGPTWTALEAVGRPVAVSIDAAALSGTVSAGVLNALAPDVLFIGPPEPGDALTAEEIAVVRAFVEAGGGLVAAGALDSDLAPAQTEVLAELLGFEPTLEYILESEPSRFSHGPGGGLGRRISFPYAPAAQARTRPFDASWTDAVVTADLAGQTDDGGGVIATHGRRVFFSHAAANSSREADRQLVYNAILHAAFDVPWLGVQEGNFTITMGESATAPVMLNAGLLGPGAIGSAALLVDSNDPPQQLLPIQLSASAAAQLAFSVSADLRAGESASQIQIIVLNLGTEPAPTTSLEVTTNSTYVGFSVQNAGIPVLQPGESFTAQASAAVAADTPDGTPVLMSLEAAASAGMTWTGQSRLTVSRTSTVSGTVVSGTGAIANEPVSWTGTAAEGQTTSGADGSFTAELPDGDYLIWAGGSAYAESVRRPISVPPDTAGLRFSLTRPGLEISPTAITSEIALHDTETQALTLSGTGDAAVSVHLDWVPGGLNSRYGDFLFDPPPAPDPVAGPDTDWIWGRLLLLKEDDPLGNPFTEALLDAHGVPYDVMPAAAMGSLDLSPYDKIILVSNQPTEFASGLETHRQWLEDWVSAGGFLQLHLAFNNHFEPLVGGLRKVQQFVFGDGAILDAAHPTYSEPWAIQSVGDDSFPFADTWFTEVPAGADTLLVGATEGQPVTVEFPFGDGAILATGQLVEDDLLYFENMLLYRLGRPRWADLSGRRAARIESGESAAALVATSGRMPGDDQEALLRVRSTDPTQRSILVPVALTALDVGLPVVRSVTVLDDDGALDAGQEADLLLELYNSGTADYEALSVDVAATGLSVISVSPAMLAVPAQGSADLTVRVAADASTADGTEAELIVSVTDAGGRTLELQAAVVVQNDNEAPPQTQDLTLVRAYRTGAVLRFTEPTDDATGGTVDSLEFRYFETPIDNFDFATPLATVPGAAGGQERLVALDLPEGFSNYVAFRAYDDAGNASGISNSVWVETQSVLTVDVVGAYQGSDGLVGAGETIYLTAEVSSAGGSVVDAVTAQVTGGYSDGGVYVAYSGFVGQVGPDPTTVWPQFTVGSETPVGTELAIRLWFLGDDGYPIDVHDYPVTVRAGDDTPPFISDNRFLARTYALGDAVTVSGNVYEPGPVATVGALVMENGEEIARVPMSRGEDGRWAGSWTTDRVGDFEVAYEASDSAGNTGTAEGGAYQGFTTRGFTPAARNLIVVDAVNGYGDEAGRRVASVAETAGLSVDTWRSYVHGRDLSGNVLSAYDGSIIYLAPQGSFSTLTNFLPEETRISLAGHMTQGGSVLLAAAGIPAALPADWLLEWFGASAVGEGAGTASGVADDVVGAELTISTTGDAVAGGDATVMSWENGSAAAVRYDSGTHRSVLAGFHPADATDGEAGALLRAAVTWMSGDPTDDVPPSAVASLRAARVADDIELTWFAPGDDGTSGRAMGYQLRYAAEPPGQDWAGWWEAATPVDLPRPSAAFTEETFVISALADGQNWFFLLRAEDDGRNLSPFSNLARIAPGHPSSVGVDEGRELPERVTLDALYPNPAATSARIGFGLPEPVDVRMEVFDLLGRRVALVSEEPRGAGWFEQVLQVRTLAAGVYVVRLRAGTEVRTRQLVVVR
ncbi:MAG: S8 family serine peptidase [Rhodothermales bacterium]|nr:S8 family serine peptidase [Rhodothermales bacterium]MBO6781059.1 S8 family serine peptidase [Rhodothermales bacterium]